MTSAPKLVVVLVKSQTMRCYDGDTLHRTYSVSTGKNGLGEVSGSECTPRGWHRIHRIIGLRQDINSVFVARQWTGERYSADLAKQCPKRDWILTRIIQLDGLESGRNHEGEVDSLARYIYIHGVPDTTRLGVPGSHGCVRMSNIDIMDLADWVTVDDLVCIESF